MSHSQPTSSSFSDYLNNNYGSSSSFQFQPIIPSEGTAEAAATAATATTTNLTDVFKRRLSEVAWSHTMEVSEEKRYKMANKRR